MVLTARRRHKGIGIPEAWQPVAECPMMLAVAARQA